MVIQHHECAFGKAAAAAAAVSTLLGNKTLKIIRGCDETKTKRIVHDHSQEQGSTDAPEDRHNEEEYGRESGLC